MEVETLAQACLRNNLRVHECIYKNPPRSVYQATHIPSNHPFILKIQRFGIQNSAPDLMQEIAAMTQLSHPHIVTCHGGFWYYSSEVTWEGIIVLEKADADLQAETNRRKLRGLYWSDFEVLKLAYDLVDALAYCELKGICHRDIKLQNILYTKGSVKITDFGICKITQSESQLHTICGSLAYLSPILRTNYNRSVSVSHNPYKSDVYSLGVTLFAVCNLGLPALVFSDPSAIQSQIIGLRYCETVKALLSAMLQEEEAARPSYNQIQAALVAVLGYTTACPHIAEGLAITKVMECHGNLCEFCYAVKGEKEICRLCPSEAEAAICSICKSAPGKLPFCTQHPICSVRCAALYCEERGSLEQITCPSCKEKISEETLSQLLNEIEVKGISIGCLQCGKIRLVEQSVILRCNQHAICQLCLSAMETTLPSLCPKCETPSVLCQKCNVSLSALESAQLSCAHSVCKKCFISPEACPLCTSLCQICSNPLSLSDRIPLPCGHTLCVACRNSPCKLCFVVCIHCKRCVSRTLTFPLECGRHTMCLSHSQLQCEVCATRSRK